MPYIKDYNDFFNDHDAEQERKLERRPRCQDCGEHIQSDVCYEIEDGYLVCPECLDRYFKKNTEDYTRD